MSEGQVLRARLRQVEAVAFRVLRLVMAGRAEEHQQARFHGEWDTAHQRQLGGLPEPLGTEDDTPLQHREQALTPLTATITDCGGISSPFPYYTDEMMLGDDITMTAMAFGRCTPGTVAHVRFEVRQFMGDSVSDDIYFDCPYVP